MTVTVLLGGARSGKSGLAVRLAAATERPVTMLATGEAGDEEMRLRIDRHRAERPADWETVEEPLDVEEAVRRIDPERTLILDCVTLWVSNAFGAGWDDAAIEDRAALLAMRLVERRGPTLVVANEVGWGIVPGDPLSRRFRDVHGRVNRQLVTSADEAALVVAGRVLPLLQSTDVWPGLAPFDGAG